jgi:DNA-binding response OmpR family regulator
MTISRILVVEDDQRLAATLDRVLTAEGHRGGGACGPDDA